MEGWCLALLYGDYLRLALHDAGTFQVVGKKNGINGRVSWIVLGTS